MGATPRLGDPFVLNSARLLSAKGTVSLFDFLKVSIYYHHLAGSELNPNRQTLNLFANDVHFKIYPGPEIVNF